MAKATELFPLPDEERKALVKLLVASEISIAVIGLIGAIILHGLSTGDWLGALVFGWAANFAAELTLSWPIVAIPLISMVVELAIDKYGKKLSASYRASRLALNQGSSGEIPRLSLAEITLCMVLAGVFEEILFRYVLIGLLMLGLTMFLPWIPAAVLAVAISTVLFWSLHSQYRDPWSIALTMFGGVLLGTCYVLTGSLLSCMIGHTVHNILVGLYDRRCMVTDPDFFGGKVPTSAILDTVAKKDEHPAAPKEDNNAK